MADTGSACFFLAWIKSHGLQKAREHISKVLVRSKTCCSCRGGRAPKSKCKKHCFRASRGSGRFPEPTRTPPPFYFVRGDLRLLNSFRSAAVPAYQPLFHSRGQFARVRKAGRSPS